MKKVCLMVLSVTLMHFADAQKTRLNLYGNYVFDDSYDYYGDINTFYSGKVKGGFQYGGGLEFQTTPTYGVELLYLHQSTQAPTTFKSGLTTAERKENFDLSLNYLMLAGNRYVMSSDSKVEGFGGLMFGAMFGNIEAPSVGRSASNTSFAWGAKLGANIWASPKVGIKLQAQFLSASRATGGEYYFSYYGPVILETYSSIYQFALGGGLTFRLGK